VLDEAQRARRTAASFPAADEDYFKEMDGGLPLTRDEVQGRNMWLVWTGGNDRFWDAIGVSSVGNLDYLKTLSSHPTLPYGRDSRFRVLGLINEPCYKKATGPDPSRYGLWLDVRDPGCPADPFANAQKYPGVAIGSRGKSMPLGSYYGEPTGIVGLRLFPNPDFDEGARKMLAILASRAAASIENARLYDDLVVKNEALLTANLTLEENFQQTVAGFAQALEESDKYTRGHSERVAFYSSLTAKGLTLGDQETERIVQAGLMHDIGKIGIRYEKLNKPGKLTPEEVSMFREHPDKGRRIMQPIPCMRHLIEGAWCHHEFFDGAGYPQGLAGDTIPLLGRIVALADAYDAMTSDRAYRRAMKHDVAVAEIERCSGTQFDPEIAELFLARLSAMRTEAKKRGDLGLVPP